MSGAYEIRVPSWRDLVAQLAVAEVAGTPTRPAYLFRGQADAGWDLSPSFARLSRDGGLTEAAAREIERDMIGEFRAQAHLYLPAGILPREEDTVTWWAIMQHYGAPTRLLDWTESPYVGLYFVVESEPRRDGVLWVMHPSAVDSHGRTIFGVSTLSRDETAEQQDKRDERIVGALLSNEGPGALLIATLRRLTSRMVAQKTQFTVATAVLADHADLIAAAVPTGESPNTFVKLVIPGGSKVEFMRNLRRMNITASSLFPGADGLGRSARELARLEVASRGGIG